MLPQGSEPLILADGTVISPENGNVIVEEHVVTVPNTVDIKREITASRMRVSDLPVPPDQMNTLSVIIGYSMMGVSDDDIANVIMIPLEQIKSIKLSDEYRLVQDGIVNNIMNSDSSSVRNMFVEGSRNAASLMVQVVNDSEMGINTRMSAAKDVLDRAGQRPVDVIEHRHKMEGGLTIEYVEKKDDIPTIDITPEF
tara:strand:+ start:2172 stop:2762 length:591 start_codon:yes stop_codon:yes gene_type:complete